MRSIIYHISIFTFFIILIAGCKKLVVVDPPVNSLTSENVYTTDISAVSVITELYSRISAASPLGNSQNSRVISGVTVRAGLSADELVLFGGSSTSQKFLLPYYTNSLSSAETSTMWDEYYANLYVVNLSLEKLENSTALTPAVKQQLIGESKFLRAFYFFYLTNMYGEVPLTISSNYLININLPRSTVAKVYDQIIADLKEAQQLLSNQYLTGDALTPYSNGMEERVRPTKYAATALLARTYLYAGKWADAEMQASSVINHLELYDLASIDDVFLKNSVESIWQLQPVNTGWNTEDARLFILPAAGPNFSRNPLVLDAVHLVNTFADDDARKLQWIGDVVNSLGETFYYPKKYKSATLNAPVSEYLMVLRLGEQYLIRAEAFAQQDRLTDAQADLNTIRNRAVLGDTILADKNALLSGILLERQRELFTEWGHRWFDLKRTGQVDAVMSAVAVQKGGTWNTNAQLYPIPQYDIQQNSSLTQNLGY
jgi:starch-binding outer membrane protein, SusD/RagB family